MFLSEAVSESLDGHLRRYKRPEEYRPKILQIVEMSRDGRTLEEIRNVTKVSQGNINSARKWARQAGLW